MTMSLKGFKKAQNTLYKVARNNLINEACKRTTSSYLNRTKAIGGWS